jgi:hypothetical protein
MYEQKTLRNIEKLRLYVFYVTFSLIFTRPKFVISAIRTVFWVKQIIVSSLSFCLKTLSVSRLFMLFFTAARTESCGLQCWEMIRDELQTVSKERLWQHGKNKPAFYWRVWYKPWPVRLDIYPVETKTGHISDISRQVYRASHFSVIREATYVVLLLFCIGHRELEECRMGADALLCWRLVQQHAVEAKLQPFFLFVLNIVKLVSSRFEYFTQGIHMPVPNW